MNSKWVTDLNVEYYKTFSKKMFWNQRAIVIISFLYILAEFSIYS